MDQGVWITVDRYLSDTLIAPDHQMDDALETAFRQSELKLFDFVNVHGVPISIGEVWV